MSFLAEVSSSGGGSGSGPPTLEYSSGNNNGSANSANNSNNSGNSGGSSTQVSPGESSHQFDYHLPHTKTIDLIGEEFAPRKDSPTITTGSSIAIVTSSGGLPVSSTLFLNSNNILTTLAPLSGTGGSSLLQAISGGQVVTLPNVTAGPSHHELLSVAHSGNNQSQSSEGPSVITATLPFNTGTATGLGDVISQPLTTGGPGTATVSAGGNPEENGVLLCNLDELSRYIPETFYSDFISEPKLDYLDSGSSGSNSSVVASSGSLIGKHGLPSLSVASNVGLCSPSSIMVSSCGVATSSSSVSTMVPSLSGSHHHHHHLPTHFSSAHPGTPITIQLPTQPQPPTGVKTLTYVQNNTSAAKAAINAAAVAATTANATALSNNAALQPVKLTTGFAYTATGEKFSIQGLTDPHHHHKGNSTLQVQVKPQTLQLAGLDPSKLAVLQELPDVSKVVIQESGKGHVSGGINSLLEDMKDGSSGGGSILGGDEGPVGYTTAIPVAVSSLNTSKKTVLMPNKRSRNIIFAGNTLPQGAIPIQINGLNALPISAVKSIPLSIGSLSAAAAASSSTNALVRKTGIPGGSKLSGAKQIVSPLKCPLTVASTSTISYSSTLTTTAASSNGSTPGKAIGGGSSGGGNNKTCTWVFENGEVCGKTFSKSYNLVVHMRMHEDVRPFCCSLCDQTFRQKAHLQRHETTHGIGVKVSRNASSSNSASNLKKRKKKAASQHITLPAPANTQPTGLVGSLQKRLNRVDEKFSLKSTQADHHHIKGPKFSSAEIDEAIKAAVEGSSLSGNTAGLLTLKREPSECLEVDEQENEPRNKIPHLSVKVEDKTGMQHQQHQQQTVIQQSSSHPQQVLVTSSSSSGKLTTTTTNQPITAQFVQHPGSTTIVIDNLEDHSPEIQKEILNALLSDHASGTSLFTIAPQQAPISNDKTEVVVEEQGAPQSYPPVTVQEFLQDAANAAAAAAVAANPQHILVESASGE